MRAAFEDDAEAVRATYLESYREALSLCERVRAIVAARSPYGKHSEIAVHWILKTIGGTLETGGEEAVRDALEFLPTWAPKITRRG